MLLVDYMFKYIKLACLAQKQVDFSLCTQLFRGRLIITLCKQLLVWRF